MKRSFFYILFLGLVIFSCNSDEIINPNTVELNFVFSHSVNGSPVLLDQLIYKNALNQEFSIKTIKYFISGVKLYKEDNTVIELADIHYVDVRTVETLTYLFENNLPEGDYTGISFIYGLIPEENISGRFTTAPESLMEWPEPMGGGYHYMKLEGEYRTPSEESFFNFHAGMLDGVAYEIHVDLKNQPFTISGNSLHINLNMEIQNWFKNPTDWDFVFFGPAIMGSHGAQEVVQQNGVDVFSFVIAEGL